MIDIAAIFKYKNRILRQIPARDRILRKIFQKEFKLKSKEKNTNISTFDLELQEKRKF